MPENKLENRLFTLPSPLASLMIKLIGGEKIIEVRRQLKGDLKYLKDRYGLRIIMGRLNSQDDPDIVSIKKLSLLEAVTAVRVLREEIIKYPPEYIRYSKVDTVRLVRDLVCQNKRHPKGESLDGLAVYEDHLVYFSTNNGDMLDFRDTIHHDLFHMSDDEASDLEQEASVISLLASIIFKSPPLYLLGKQILSFINFLREYNWASLNPKGKAAYIGDDYQQLSEPPDGFVSDYGTYDLYEDRSTVAALLMTDIKEALLSAENDDILQKKIIDIMGLFKIRSLGRMDSQYFNDLLQGKVREGYWEKK
jgi:hypothetical protein